MDINVIDLIQTDLLIIIAVVYVLGMFLKKLPNIADWSIPMILLFVSMALTTVYKADVLNEGYVSSTVVNGVIYGILIAGICVFGNQLIKQSVQRD